MDTVALKEVRVGVIGTEAEQGGQRANLERDERQAARQDSDVHVGEPEPAARSAAPAFELGRQAWRDEDADARACTPIAVHVEAVIPGRVAAEGAELHRPPL